MHARKGLMLCLLAGLASPAFAGVDEAGSAGSAASPAATPRMAPTAAAAPTHHVYINLRTGERTISKLRGSSCNPPIWTNTDIASNGGFFWALDDPTSTFPISGNQQIGGEGLDWGDIEFDSVVDGYQVAYASDIGAGTAIAGLTLINWWYDADDGFGTASIPVTGIGVSSIPGGDPTSGALTGWILTIDLCGTGLEFELGDRDGSAGATGADLDDGSGCPEADFAYSYLFDQSGTGLALGIAGPFLVLPAFTDPDDEGIATGGAGTAFGVADAFDLYEGGAKATGGIYDGTYNFGGWVPMGANPYASFYMELCGVAGLPCGCSLADYNGDTVVDITDQLDFFGDFGVCSGMPAPCAGATVGNPDINNDGTIDVSDQLDFLDVYDRCD